MDESPPLTTTEVGKILGVTRPTVLKLIRSGQLRAIRICPGVKPRFKIHREALDEFLARNTTAAPTPPVEPAKTPRPRSKKFELLVRRPDGTETRQPRPRSKEFKLMIRPPDDVGESAPPEVKPARQAKFQLHLRRPAPEP